MGLLTGKNILCVRLDNMGDILMSSPALDVLSKTEGCNVTLLTSSQGNPIAPFIPSLSDVIVYDAPWVGLNSQLNVGGSNIVTELRSREFDAAVIFSVYSQSTLPAATFLYYAGIPVRIGYCRENPYDLLTHWIPDDEPYMQIKHQVQRDLDLLAAVGVQSPAAKLVLTIPPTERPSLLTKLSERRIDLEKSMIVVHPGVSERKREYPAELWSQIIDLLEKDFQVVVTGGKDDVALIDRILSNCQAKVISMAGALTMGEFINLVDMATAVLCVNTVTSHIAAATQTPVGVLYALTNPQHAPWMVPHKVFPFSVPPNLQSRNRIIKHVNDSFFSNHVPFPDPEEVVSAMHELLHAESKEDATDLVFP